MLHARRALEIDPNYALAWSAVADTQIFLAIRGVVAPAEAITDATRAANRALELDPFLAEAHASIGVIRSHTGDLAGGIRALRKAIELNPGNASAYSLLGRALYSYELHEEALAVKLKSAGVGNHSAARSSAARPAQERPAIRSPGQKTRTRERAVVITRRGQLTAG